MAPTEADTCRKFVVPKLQAAGWDTPPHAVNEQRTFTDGRIVFARGKARRGRQKRVDYLLRYRPDFPIAVVEAKSRFRPAGDGLQQAKHYAEVLGLKFAYATNGAEIIEFDYTSGAERTMTEFPEPGELWRRLRAAQGLADDRTAEKLLAPAWPDREKPQSARHTADACSAWTPDEPSRQPPISWPGSSTPCSLVARRMSSRIWRRW